MAEGLRAKSRKMVVTIMIGLLAMSFAVWGISDVFTSRQSDTLAEVGSRQISAQEYNRLFNRQLQEWSRRVGRTLTVEQGRELGLDRLVLGQLLRDAALEAQADEMRLLISDKTIAQRIADNSRYQTSDGAFDRTQFQRLLQNAGISEQMFFIAERQGLLRASIANTIERGASVPGEIAKLAYKYRNEQRDVRYFTVTVPEASISEPSDSELKSFHDKNKQLFGVPETRLIAVMQVTPDSLSDRIEVSDGDIAAYYEQRKADFAVAEKRTIQRIPFDNLEEANAARAKIDGGKSFLDLAKEKGLSETDINLGTFTRQALPDPAIAEAAFALEKDVVSKAVEGKLSTVLLKVTAIEAGSQKSFAEASDEIRQHLLLDLARDEVLSIYDKVEEARASGQSLEEIAKDQSLKVIEMPPVDRSGQTADGAPLPDLADPTGIVSAAFESDTGVDNDPITTNNDGYVWFEVRDMTPASVKPLADARDDAIKGWKTRQLRIAVLDKAEELRKRAEAGERLSKLATEANAELKTRQGIKRHESSEDFNATAVQALFSVREDGFATAIAGDGKGAKLMQSTPVLAQPYDANSADAKSMQKELSASMANDLYAQYLADVQRRIGVQIDQNVLANAANRAYQHGGY